MRRACFSIMRKEGDRLFALSWKDDNENTDGFSFILSIRCTYFSSTPYACIQQRSFLVHGLHDDTPDISSNL